MSTDTPRNEPAPTLEEVWALFKATDLKFQETDRQFKETDRQIKEIALQSKETDRLIKEIAETMQKNHNRLDKEIDKVNQTIGNLGNRLGQFVESMIKPSIVRLFQARGIPVHKVSQDISADYPERGLATQIDLMAINDEVCVLIEVKSRLTVEDVNEHVERLSKFKWLFPEYADKTVYGAVATMVLAEAVSKYAYRKGFFVIVPSGETAVILNDSRFKPAAW